MNTTLPLSYFLALILLYGCAQIKPLDGGDKDTTAPIILKTTPKNNTVLFNKKKVVFQFNEFINSSAKIKKEFVISPPVKNFSHKVVGKSLTLNIKDTLIPKTTYTISLGKGVKDITEGNILKNGLLTFSTGNHIDSLKISGTIKHANTLLSANNFKVLLYKDTPMNDSILKLIPDYVARTNDAGKYTFKNLRPGKYTVFSFKDKNHNLIMQPLEKDSMGFFPSYIDVQKDIENDSVNLFVFLHKERFNFIKKVTKKNNHEIIVRFSNNVDKTRKIVSSIKNSIVLEKWSKEGKEVAIWFNPLVLKDSIKLLFFSKNKLLDSTYHIINTKKVMKKDTLPLSLSFNASTNKQLNPSDSLKIISSIPFKIIHPKGIKLFADSQVTILAPIIKNKKWITSYTIPFNFMNKDYTNYHLEILPFSIKSIKETVNDSISLNFKPASKNNYGVLSFNVNTDKNKWYVFYLLNSKKAIVLKRWFKESSSFSTKLIEKGNYFIKVISDENKDKKWTEGNYLKRRQPEKVFIYKKTIKVIENFEKNITWNLYK